MLRHPAEFINALEEEGTKAEAIEYLQKQWDENCELRSMLSTAMKLLFEMPIKHPQQAQRRDELAKRCGFTAQQAQSEPTYSTATRR